jgi:hypothetical protein
VKHDRAAHEVTAGDQGEAVINLARERVVPEPALLALAGELDAGAMLVVRGGGGRRAGRRPGTTADRELDVHPDRGSALSAGDGREFLRLTARMWTS